MDDDANPNVATVNAEVGEADSLTRRQAVGAGAIALTGLALGSGAASAATTAAVSGYNRTVVVHAPRGVVFNLDAVQALQRDILGRLGCFACCSGWNILFPDEVEFVVGKGNAVSQLGPAQINARLGVGR
jgi:hypothetical protein